MQIIVQPVGWVTAQRSVALDDYWGQTEAIIELNESFSDESLMGLESFSHVEVLFYFDQVDQSKIVTDARHPRNNADWPRIGIFAQRGKNRPNRIGSTICPIVRVEGKRLFVLELDAIDGTPVLDLKPVMAEFLPRTEVTQPQWSHELMSEYWKTF